MDLHYPLRVQLSVEQIVLQTRPGTKGVASEQTPTTHSAQPSIPTAVAYMQVRLCNIALRPAINGGSSAMGLDWHCRVLFCSE